MENKRVRRILIAAMLIILGVLLALMVFFYNNHYKPMLEKKPDMSNVYVPDSMKGLTKGEKVLIAEVKDADFKLYSAGDFVVVSYKGQEAEFSDWSKNIANETPEIYYNDFDGDGEKEFVIKALKEVDEETKEHVYCLYTVFPIEGEDGKITFTVRLIDRSDWYESFSRSIRAEMSQPSGAPNRLQLAMNTAGQSIAYDSVTGILSSGHGWFARALTNNAGKYYTFKNWEKGLGEFSIDNEQKQINVGVTVYATYKEVETKQNVGSIKCGLVVAKDGVSLRSKSLYFEPNSEYTVTDPTVVADANWSATLKNSAPVSGKSSKMIDKLSLKCDFSSVNKTKDISFSGRNDDSGSIEKIVASNDVIKVYAREGYSFAKTKTVNRDYSAEVTVGKTECDTSLEAAVETENGRSVLVYKLDKNYPSAELANVHIKFGA